jgi:5-methylcytosine-specific restriction endonuclease McrA
VAAELLGVSGAEAAAGMVSLAAEIREETRKLSTRGTTNKNVSGNSTDRRRRKAWLVDTYRADVDVVAATYPVVRPRVRTVSLGRGVPACRCYRCGTLLTVETVSVDRIVPGCLGGTYRRDNIRPACAWCNSSTGGKLTGKGTGKR